MTVSYTQVGAQALNALHRLITVGYEVTSRGVVVQVRIDAKMYLPGQTTQTELTNSHISFFVLGIDLSDLSSTTYTLLETTDLGRGSYRQTWAFTVTDTGSIVLSILRNDIQKNNETISYYMLLNAFWACGVQISGTDLINIVAAVC